MYRPSAPVRGIVPQRSARLLRTILAAALAPLTHALPAHAQEALKIVKIDPPNWYADLPRPMLLVRGEGFHGASFSLSDKTLRIERTELSANGHYAQLWLSASPQTPETITLSVRRGASHAEQPYTFAARRNPNSGMAGMAPQDVIYLILTDRFADGDPSNDGPLAHSTAESAEAASERSNPRGWHGGDLRGIERHLDYLQQLGITTVWTTPVYQNHAPEAYHGYHATDYYAVDEHYGSMSDLQALVKSLHTRGMKLLLDTVPNHVGPLHPWVSDSPTPDWFHGTAAHHIAGETNFDALIDPHASAQARTATLDGWFVNSLPDMNTTNPAVAVYLRQNAIWWIEQTGADGLRIDTFPYVDRPFWNAMLGQLRQLYPHLTEVGEVSNRDPEITSSFADGVTRSGVDTHLYTPFDFPFYHASRDIFAGGQSFTRLARVLESDELYPHPERLVPFLGNHDETRFAEPVTDPATQQLAYTLLLTTRGTPQLYAGDEIGMHGANDPDNRRDFPGGFPGPFPGASADAFSHRTPEQDALFTTIAFLNRLRTQTPALGCGAEQVLLADQNTLAYIRSAAPASACTTVPTTAPPDLPDHATGSILVVLHRGPAASIALDLHDTAASGCKAESIPLPGHAIASPQQNGDRLQLNLAAEAALLRCR